jgi:chaperonin GroEL (HSP60 family)
VKIDQGAGSRISREAPLIISDAEGEALATLVVNKLRGGLKVAAGHSKSNIAASISFWFNLRREGCADSG